MELRTSFGLEDAERNACPWFVMRRSLSVFLYFVGSAILTVLAVGIARLLVQDDPGYRAAKTLLDERIETAREIRRALATPIPPPDPLPPITAKPARDQSTRQGDARSPIARDAMARGQKPANTTGAPPRDAGRSKPPR